jgi:hypothetical protein
MIFFRADPLEEDVLSIARFVSRKQIMSIYHAVESTKQRVSAIGAKYGPVTSLDLWSIDERTAAEIEADHEARDKELKMVVPDIEPMNRLDSRSCTQAPSHDQRRQIHLSISLQSDAFIDGNNGGAVRNRQGSARRGRARSFWQNEPKIPLINQFRQQAPSLLGSINDQIDFPTGQTQTVTQCHEGTASNPQKPTETVSETASVSIGGSSNDQFIFKPGIGADVIAGSRTERKLSNLPRRAASHHQRCCMG